MAKENPIALLSPELMNSMEGLELLARQLLEGQFTGPNPSIRSGQGQTFRQYRSYQPGDDLRQLDWKMYARSDRYYIKEAEVESQITLSLVLDCSASMLHQDGGITKLDFARVTAAALAYLAHLQGDSLSLFAVNDAGIQQMEPQQGPKQLQRILHTLAELSAHGQFPGQGETAAQMYRSNHKALTVVLTDMYEHGNELQHFIRDLAALRHEVLVCLLMAENESKPDFRGTRTFEDLETGKTVQVDARQMGKVLSTQIADWERKLQQSLLGEGVELHSFCITESPAKVLPRFLESRIRLR